MDKENIVPDYILLIGDAKGYLLGSIRNNLCDAKLEVSRPSENMTEISKIEREVTAILIFADESVVRNYNLLVYLRNKAVEDDIPIFVIGYIEELNGVKEIIPEHLIQWEILRPVDIKEMVSQIKEYLLKRNSNKKKKILVVDDSSVMLNSIKRWLGDKYQITLAESGVTAIKCMVLNRPDLILLDYDMPICDGKQTLEMIRAEKELSDISVIFLTAKSDRDSIMGVMALKPEGYILKAMLKPGEIKQYIDDYFKKKEAELKIK